MKYRLVGARKFLNIAKPGTIFIPIDFYCYGKANENIAERIVQEFKNNPKNSYDTRWGLLHIFINNGGSITFYYDMINCSEDDDYIYYYDYNIVGDANPESTLYLIVNSIEDIPDSNNFYCYGSSTINEPEFDKDLVIYNNKEKVYEHYLNLSKEEVKQRYKNIVNDYCGDNMTDMDNEWAKEELSIIDNPVLDIDIEVEE